MSVEVPGHRIPVMNLGHLLTQSARAWPDHPVLVHEGTTWTYARMNRRVDAIARHLVAQGLKPGDRVLVQSRNCVEMFEALWAVLKAGLVFVPTNYRLTPTEVAYLGEASGARAVIVENPFPEHLAAIRAACADLVTEICIGEPLPGTVGWDAVIDADGGEPFEERTVFYGSPCWFFFTSGTTGRPKAAVLTHGQMAFIVTNHLADLLPGTSERSASLIIAPLSHGAGVHMLNTVARGGLSAMISRDKFDVAEAWDLIRDHRVDNMFTVPVLLNRLVDYALEQKRDPSGLRQVIYAGAPMYRADQQRALEALGPCLVQYFGLGEVTGCITVLPPHLHAEAVAASEDGRSVGTCGKPRTGMQISIRNDADEEVATGEIGEICVRGPGVFAGYWNNPEANEKAFRGGWFHTGDLGQVDARGFLYITGRASDMYISGGSNVYPREAEELILTHPRVTEVAILGVPDADWGETGLAVISSSDGEEVTLEDACSVLADKLSKYKWPRRAITVAEIPKTGYGKMSKKLIRETLERDGLL